MHRHAIQNYYNFRDTNICAIYKQDYYQRMSIQDFVNSKIMIVIVPPTQRFDNACYNQFHPPILEVQN